MEEPGYFHVGLALSVCLMSESMVINAKVDLRFHNFFIHEKRKNDFPLALFTWTKVAL